MVTWQQRVNEDFDMCFGCGRNNPIGLKLNFDWHGKTARAEFTPTKFYQGWSGVVHGGIVTTILDEAMGWTARFEGVSCVTGKIQVRLRRPALIDEPLIITSSMVNKTEKLIETRANISLKDGTLVAEGGATQFIVGNKEEPKGNARKRD